MQVKAPSEFSLGQHTVSNNQEVQLKTQTSAMGQLQGISPAQISSPQPSGAKFRGQYDVMDSAQSNLTNRN